jgi:enoyl-CoA hydratase/carnithine racemase
MMILSTEDVRLSFDGSLAIVTLARPAKFNALTAAMIRALDEAADAIETAQDCRCVLLTGEGRGFCAGGDIADWGGLAPLDMWRAWVRTGHRVFDRWTRLRVPVIAALNGHALGGGLELAAVADFRLAEPYAKFGLPETGIGMVPGWSGTQRLVQRFGAPLIRKLCFTGVVLTAPEALAAGLIDEVVPEGTVLDRAKALAAQISQRAPVAVSLAKDLINAAEGEGEASAFESIAGALVAYTDDCREGVASFQEKRAPRFQNR